MNHSFFMNDKEADIVICETGQREDIELANDLDVHFQAGILQTLYRYSRVEQAIFLSRLNGVSLDIAEKYPEHFWPHKTLA